MTKYNDTPVKLMVYPSIIFMVIGMAIGVFLSFNTYLFPDYFSGEYIHFGKLRPVHVHSVAILWLYSVSVGFFYYFVPRLCGVQIWSAKMAYWSAGLWWFSLVIAEFSYPWGTNFGWEYAELPDWVWWIPTKPLFVVAWLLVVVNIFATIATRKYKKMYVSLWYTMGTLIWGTFTYLAGSYAINWVPGGISRVNISWFYVHNLVGLIFTPMGLATAYYFLPKLANTPIYSHRLSMVGFWSIAFIYAWTGAHHMIHGPISQWLQTVAIIFSIWLFIPVWTVVHNLFYTLLPKWKEFTQSTPVRFLMMGTMFYFITCIQGPLMALRNVNEITSKTDWIIGHAHVSLYATFTFFAFAGVYQVIPVITKKPLWSKAMAEWHFALNMIGSIPFMIALWIGGFYQGMLWAYWADGTTYAEFQNNLSVMPFLKTNALMHPWWAMRAIGGTIILIANIIFLINIFNTILLKPREKEEVVA
ncbi:MAG: hypothetical protein K940chlam7_00270 [Chlamydiae bacterium]|nr:hypothetical protein [Chlamydiota bacterium]